MVWLLRQQVCAVLHQVWGGRPNERHAGGFGQGAWRDGRNAMAVLNVGLSINGGTPKWMVMENHMFKIDDLGVPLWLRTPPGPYVYINNYRWCHDKWEKWWKMKLNIFWTVVEVGTLFGWRVATPAPVGPCNEFRFHDELKDVFLGSWYNCIVTCTCVHILCMYVHTYIYILCNYIICSIYYVYMYIVYIYIIYIYIMCIYYVYM